MMRRQIENHIVTGAWLIGIILAGSDGALSPLINLVGGLMVAFSSWFIHVREACSDVMLKKIPAEVSDARFPCDQMSPSAIVWMEQGRGTISSARLPSMGHSKWRS